MDGPKPWCCKKQNVPPVILCDDFSLQKLSHVCTIDILLHCTQMHANLYISVLTSFF